MFYDTIMQIPVQSSRIFGTAFLIVSALFTLLTGLASFASPAVFGQRLGLVIAGADGMNEIRAQYGGFFCAVAIIDALALARLLPRNAAFVLNAAIFGGLFAGRILSLLLDGGYAKYGSTINTLFFIDGLGILLSSVSLLLESRH
jgi:hypothetical protein